MNEKDKLDREQYPNGKLCDDDSGASCAAIFIQDNAVILTFPVPMDWIGLSPDSAIAMGEEMIKKAQEIQRNVH